MNSKDNPLRKAGYDYGDTLWGTGEGWGYWSPVNIQLNLKKRTIKELFFQSDIPGYAAIGGSGCYSNHIDLIRNEVDEQQLKDVEDRIDETGDDEEAAEEEATYELSNNEIEDREDRFDYRERERRDTEDRSDEDDIFSHIEDDLRMIDCDAEK